jgi:hypothetical protein
MSRIKVILASSGPDGDRIVQLVVNLISNVMSYGSAASPIETCRGCITRPTLSSCPGMVLPGAIVAGLPTVSTPNSSMPKVVGDAGALIRPNNPLSIYETIKGQESDEWLRQHLSLGAGRRIEEKFSSTAYRKNLVQCMPSWPDFKPLVFYDKRIPGAPRPRWSCGRECNPTR